MAEKQKDKKDKQGNKAPASTHPRHRLSPGVQALILVIIIIVSFIWMQFEK